MLQEKPNALPGTGIDTEEKSSDEQDEEDDAADDAAADDAADVDDAARGEA